MKMRKYIYSLLITCVTSHVAWAQADYPHLREGDELYSEGRYTDAETSYRKALIEKEKAGTSFNLANSMFLQNRIPEAIMEYQKTIETSRQPDVKSNAFYNMGNAYFQNKEYEQSIQAYKEALKINPGDEDAKKNLMLAMRQLKQEQQQEQPNEQQDQQQQDQQQQQQEQDQQQSKQQQQQQQQQQKEEVSKEEANEILKAIEREDQRVQEKLKKNKAKTSPPVKDW